MPPKRKRDDNSDEELQRDTKRFKTEQMTCLTLDSLPDDCLCEILCHLPQVSVCSSLLTNKRLNNTFEALVTRALSKKLDFSSDVKGNINAMPQATKKQLTEILFPRAQYTALERKVMVEADLGRLERYLVWLHSWALRKFVELKNVRQFKSESPELWKHLYGRYAYKEISPANTFALWEGTDGSTDGENVHVSFFLFGQSGHFIEVTCDVLSYYEHPGGSHACKLIMNAKLNDNESTEVTDLLKGYLESPVPQSDACDTEENIAFYRQRYSIFNEYERGDRVMCKWYHTCFPALSKVSLNRVIEWLGWNVSPIELAKILVGLSRSKYIGRSGFYVDDKSQPAEGETLLTFDKLLSLAMNEDDEQCLSQVERTLALLEAKIKLKNRIKDKWQEKDEKKRHQIWSLVDRSVYTDWNHMSGVFTAYCDGRYNIPDYRVYYHQVRGEIKLVSEDPAKWLRFKFNTTWGRQNPDFHAGDDDSSYKYSISTATMKGKLQKFFWEPFKLQETDAKLFQTELGLENFTHEELTELIGLIADLSHEEE